MIYEMIDAFMNNMPFLNHHIFEISWTQMITFTPSIMLVKKLELLHKIKALMWMKTQLLLFMILIQFCRVFLKHIIMCSMSRTHAKHKLVL